MLRFLFRRRAAAPSPPSDWRAGNEALIARLRGQGVSIGIGCISLTDQFSLEPCLVEVGDRVAIAGRITVGDESFIGQNCIILPGARIGVNCVVGAGSVVRGTVADRSVVMGNPARVVGRTSLLVAMLDAVRFGCAAINSHPTGAAGGLRSSGGAGSVGGSA